MQSNIIFDIIYYKNKVGDMRKIISFLIVVIIIAGLAFYFTYGREYILSLDDNKIYEIKNQKTIDMKTLDECKFYNKGIVTYNNQKISHLDYENNTVWENENQIFVDRIFIADDYIYMCLDNSIEIINKNNQSYVVTEIAGKIINVSRENNRTYIITEQKDGQNSLYMLNENNEVIVENKKFNDMITGVSISDKSEGYCTTTLKFTNRKPLNSLMFNLMDDVELWNNKIENEIIVETKIINNNVLVLGTENVYFYNPSGKLMWKNSNYNNIKDFTIDLKNDELFILYEKDEKLELMCYNFDGKVKNIYKVLNNVKRIRIYGNKIFAYSENMIYLLHDNNVDKLFEVSNEQIMDFYVENSNIYVLLKGKLIKGQIS